MGENLTIEDRIAKTLDNLFESEAPESEASLDYRKAAAVLEYFSFNKINPLAGDHDDELALESLYDVSDVVYDENRFPQRRLTDAVRRETLEILYREGGFSGFQKALRANPERPETKLQKLFESFLNGHPPPVKEQSRRELIRTAQIANWLHGIVENVPDPVDISRIIESESLLAPFKFLLGVTADNPAGDFFGRENEIKKLYDYVEVYDASSSKEKLVRNVREILSLHDKPPLVIHAPGGTGKSTLLARFVLDHARYKDENAGDAEDNRFPFVYLDFDKPSLSPEEPITLLLEAVQQLAVQYPEHRSLLLNMRNKWLEEIRPSKRGSKSLPKDREFNIENRKPFIVSFAEVINNRVNINKDPLLFLIDTFEEAQWRSQAFVEGILRFLEILQEHVPRLRTVISGRTEVKGSAYELDNYRLPPFDPEAAQNFLQKHGVDDHEIAGEIAAQLGGSPLTLRLAAQLYKLEKTEKDGITDPEERKAFFSQLGKKTIQAQLYKRILGHIHLEDVRKLANPGLILRRITAPLILEVLAEPCNIEVPNLKVAEELFEELKKEVTLVSSEQGKDVLVHRPDVRSLMLKLINEDKEIDSRKIHENAIKFYEKENDEISRTEEIYHRLSLGVDREKLNERWLPNLKLQKDDIDELPLKSQGYVAARMQVEVDPEVWDKADIEDWELYAIRTARQLIQADRSGEALTLLRQRRANRSSNNIYAIEQEISIRRRRTEELKGQSFTRANQLKMSSWYSPEALGNTARATISAVLSGEKSSVASAHLSVGNFFDYTTELRRTIEDFEPVVDIPLEELWIDYVADLGDGWNSTYAVAYNIARPELEVDDQLLNRGEILIFGGDLVYPTATMTDYRNRVLIPYQMAFKAGGTNKTSSYSDIVTLKREPHIFALPGERDWNENLSAFKKIFCSYFYNNRNFADGWFTRQKQSYFALKLPHNWWLLGFDLHLGRDLDESQFQYFESVCENMSSDDRVILCVQDTYWASAVRDQSIRGFEPNEPSVERIEDFLARRGTAIDVYIAGGLHHYRRFENEEGVQRITAGGGGSFLNPTHDYDFGSEGVKGKDAYACKQAYPEPEVTKRLDWKLLSSFVWRNPTFGLVTGMAYAILAWLIQGGISASLSVATRTEIFSSMGYLDFWKEAALTTLNGLITSPLAALFLLFGLLALIFFTDSSSRAFKYVAGLLHGLANLVAIFFTAWTGFLLSIWILDGLPDLRDVSINLIWFLCIIGTAFIGGFLLGPIIMSVYLFVSLHFFGRHNNEAFSALKIEDYKNFLRLHISRDGELTIYPLKIEKVPRRWRAIFQYYEPEDRDPKPQLIEDPIVPKVVKN